MKKTLKIIFILSFIPYLYLLLNFFTLKCFINGNEIHGFERLLEVIKSNFDMLLYSPVFPTCIFIQTCYICKLQKKMIFIFPLIIILLAGLKSMFSGFTFITSAAVYGLEGFKDSLLLSLFYYSIIYPIIPIGFIIQLILIKKRDKIYEET